MNILVTGGCGFIGSNFVKHMLKSHDYKIVNLDKLTYAGNLENLKDIQNHKNYTFIKGDICNHDQVISAINKNEINTIINFAAESHVDNSIKDSSPFIKTNIDGVRVLLECAKEKKIKKFIQISTDEVYGSLEGKIGRFTENSPLDPSSAYSASKASADLLVKAYYKTFNLPIIITRSSNNFGPYQYPEKVIPLFITNILEGKKIPLYGTGKNIRNWIYVEDNCKAIDAVAHKGKVGEIYNIGGETEITNFELTEKILNLMGVGKEYIEYVQDRLGHDYRYAITNSKVKILGWNPEYDFDSALKQTVDWYKNNPDWWKSLKNKNKKA